MNFIFWIKDFPVVNMTSDLQVYWLILRIKDVAESQSD